MIRVMAEVDISELNAALNFAQQWSTRAPAQCINSCAIAVLDKAIELTPFVPMARMDQELATEVSYAPTATGRASTAKRNRRYSGGVSSIQKVKRVPLAVLIILARSNRAGLNRGQGDGTTSNYNKRTNNRWLLDAVPTKALMTAMIHRMIATRHSSSKFLISGWVEARRQLRFAKFAEPPPMINADNGRTIEHDLGRSLAAREGDVVAVCIIENLVGLGDSKNAVNYNRALIEHGLGPFQRAIDLEAEQKFEYVANKLFRNGLATGWNRHAA